MFSLPIPMNNRNWNSSLRVYLQSSSETPTEPPQNPLKYSSDEVHRTTELKERILPPESSTPVDRINPPHSINEINPPHPSNETNPPHPSNETNPPHPSNETNPPHPSNEINPKHPSNGSLFNENLSVCSSSSKVYRLSSVPFDQYDGPLRGLVPHIALRASLSCPYETFATKAC